MISLMVLDNVVYINVKMEQVYNSMSGRLYNHRGTNYMNMDFTDPDVFAGIEQLIKENKEYEHFTWIFDFSGIKVLHDNALGVMLKSMESVDDKRLYNITKLPKSIKIRLSDSNFVVENDKGYKDALSTQIVQFIKEKCIIDKVIYDTGEVIRNYINLRPAFEDNSLFFKMCFSLAEEIDERKRRVLNERILFCHTLNGACIAEMLSLLFGCDILYADRLTSQGKMRRNFMPRRFIKGNKCMIVTDIVCQGHELIRARDIITMLGGTSNECVGIIKIKLKNIHNNLVDEKFLLELDEETQKYIGYSLSIGGSNE